MSLGNPRVHLRRTGSTNERARELACAGAPHGTLLTAAEQTAGRGRQGRVWVAPPRSALLMSLLLRWSSSAQPPALLPLLAGVAVCDAIGEEAQVKWPNDVVVPRSGSADKTSRRGGGAPELAKLAGVLVEGRPQERWAVLGIGVNVAVRVEELPAEVRAVAASLERPPEAVEPLLADLLRALQGRLSQPPQTVLDAWRARDALHGREIVWEAARARKNAGGDRGIRDSQVTGRAEGIDECGRLLVALGEGARTALSAGEVRLRSTSG